MKNMKIINYKLMIALLLSIMTVGCQDDLLETFPKDELSSAGFWKTKADAINAINGIYPLLPGVSEVDWDRMSDIATTNSPSNGTVLIEKGEHDANTAHFLAKWGNAYEAIAAANYFLENVGQVQANDPSLDDELMNRLKGEARFIRAFFYTRLTMLYGDVPLITTTIDVEEAKSLTRTPQDQVWDFIEAELTEIADHLPKNYTGDDIGRVTKGAALAMKARAMLYAERWETAAAAAKAVMDLGVYSLYPNYGNLFSYEAENNSGVIFDKQYLKDIASHNFFRTTAPVSLDGRVDICPTLTLVEAYETLDGSPVDPLDPYANRDPRLDFTLFVPTFSDDVPGEVLYNGKIYDPRPNSGTGDEVDVDFYRTKTGFSMQKYINEEDMDDRSNCGTNFILIRYADVLLMYAEAKIEANQIDGTVYTAINDVRNKRDDVKMPSITTGKTQDQLRQIVRHERMVELAMEGLRFFDIRRWKTAEDLLPGSPVGMKYVPVGEPTVVAEVETLVYGGVTRTFDPTRDYLFPVPQEEITLNPNLDPNNPGY